MRTLLTISFIALAFFGYAQPTTPDICLVTVDTGSTFTKVVWDKDTVSTDIDYYNVYKQIAVSPFKQLLGSRDFDSSSVFEDHISDPNADSNTYYLTAVDLSGVESTFSAPHSTIHLTVTPNGAGGMLCSWTHYEGRMVDSYHCHRDSLINDDWEVIFASSTGTQSAWNDNDMPITSTMRYKLEVEWSSVCSTQKKAIGDFNSSRSNRTAALNNPMNVEELPFVVSEFYPNPVEDELTIRGNQRVGQFTALQVYSNDGKLIKQVPLSQGAGDFNLVVNLSELAAGSYLVVLNSTNGSFQQSIIKK